jgi:hypothetical protein
MDWTRIEREGAPEVRGIHPRHPDRLDVVISLSGTPPGNGFASSSPRTKRVHGRTSWIFHFPTSRRTPSS